MIEWIALIIAVVAYWRTMQLDKAMMRHLLAVYRHIGRLKTVKDVKDRKETEVF